MIFDNNKTNNYFLFITSVILLSLVVFLTKIFLSTDELLYNFYAEIYVQEQIDDIVERQQKWWWLGYAIIPLFVIIRSSLVAFCLGITVFFYDMENTFKFKQFLRIALLGEFVWVLVAIVKFAYFYWFQTDFDLVAFQQYYPLSFINYLDVESLDSWFVYPFQTINLFEVLYFFILVAGMHKLLKSNYWKSFEMVAVGYGMGLLVWLGLTMFLLLNIN
ncbi:hypothetical protein [Flavicella sediminum]|uniref:hypothetical protein n=1 Tax=Flavicella sediminum TaxID=2585141 RepID=UPI0011229D36|nr:hypothetical protein [Flavicella sediminum]